MMEQPRERSLFEVIILEKGKCCICEDPLTDSKFVTFAYLNKRIKWKFPGWGNILAKNPADRTSNRALAVVCDNCQEANEKKEEVGEIRFAIEVIMTDERREVNLHDVTELDDAPPIKLMTEEEQQAFAKPRR